MNYYYHFDLVATGIPYHFEILSSLYYKNQMCLECNATLCKLHRSLYIIWLKAYDRNFKTNFSYLLL